MVSIGSIYVYDDPVTGRRRHAVHFREKGSIGPWLRSFLDPPIPHEIEKMHYQTASELLKREAYFQKELKTLHLQGGLNKVLAWPAPDHSAIGKFGGGVRPMSAAAKERMLLGIGITENARKRHKSGSKKGGDAVKGTPRTYSDASRNNLKKAGKLGRSRVRHEDIVKATRIGNHVRWHIMRGIINKNCHLCRGIIV